MNGFFFSDLLNKIFCLKSRILFRIDLLNRKYIDRKMIGKMFEEYWGENYVNFFVVNLIFSII